MTRLSSIQISLKMIVILKNEVNIKAVFLTYYYFFYSGANYKIIKVAFFYKKITNSRQKTQ